MKKTAITLIALTASLMFSGCNITKVTAKQSPGNVGRELLDLHAAYEKDIINGSDYKRLKMQLLEPATDLSKTPKKEPETMIHVLASIKVKPGNREELIEIFKKNIPNVLAEDGCIQYALTEDTESGIGIQLKDENILTVIEKWESVEALNAHLAAPHMKQYSKDTEGMTEGVELKVLADA